jgi:hypothetical protein
MSRREIVLRELLNASRPIDVLAKELTEFEWDSDKELVMLDQTHVTAILTGYLEGRRTASEIRSWAETIEGRDDIGISSQYHTALQDAIFQLANPELGHVLSPLLAQKIIGKLQL